MLQDKSQVPQNKLHVWYGAVTLILSVFFYLTALAFDLDYNSTHGGGQQTLPGMDTVVTLAIVIVATILSALQILMQWRISKRQSVSLLNFLIAVPLIIFLPLSLKMMELPGKYYYPVLIGMLAGNIAACLTITYDKRTLAIGAFILIVSSIGAAASFFTMTDENSLWWDNGHDIVYNQDGLKIKEAENKKKGIIYGNYTEWDDNGELTWFRRYPNGSLQKPDSAVSYTRGQMWEMRHSFDSIGHRYERQVTYDVSTEDDMHRQLFIETLVDSTAKLYLHQEWDPRTKNLREMVCTFDSSNSGGSGVKYFRHIYYKKDGTVAKTETIVTTSDYVYGQEDKLY